LVSDWSSDVCSSDLVAGADHLARVFDEAVAEPRDVNESVLMHADVDERPEVGHVGDDARTGHSRLQVFDLVNVFAVGEGRELIARVAARFGKFGDYVREREFADFRFEIIGLFDQFNAGASQFGHALAQPGGQGFERRVAFGMPSGVVERVVGVGDAQEAGGLLEHLFAEPRDVEQLLARREEPVGRAMLDDLFGYRRADPRDVFEQMVRRGVEIDPDRVDAGIDHEVERFFERRLRNVVLILAHADALRIDFYEFRQRVLQPAGDGNRAAHRDVEFGEFFAGGGRGAVNARARFVHHDHGDVQAHVLQRVAYEALGLAAGSAVADGDGADARVLQDRSEHLLRGLLIVLRLQVHHVVGQEFPRIVDDGQLAAGPHAGVDAEHGLRPERRCEQQLPDVFGEDLDRRLVGHFFQLAVGFVFYARDYVAFQRELRGAPQEFGAGRIRDYAGFALESREQCFVISRVFGRAA